MPETTEEQLKKLYDDFTRNQNQIETLSKANKEIKPLIDELSKKVDEVKKVSDPYNQLLDNILTEKKGNDPIAKQKTAVVNDDLDDNAKNDISEKIKTVDDAIAVLESNEKEQIDKIIEINQEIDESKKNIVNKNIAFDTVKQYQKTVEADLKKLKELKIKSQKEESTKILFFILMI